MTFTQIDADAVAILDRIATYQFIMAIVLTILLIMAMFGAVIFMLEFGKLRKLLRDTSILMDELKKEAVPLIEGAAVTAANAAEFTTRLRARADGLLATLEGIDEAVQKGAIATEERIRRFGHVLDVVQTETEELLLDAAATAHGVHETARQLREVRPRRVIRRPTEIRDTELDEDLGGVG